MYQMTAGMLMSIPGVSELVHAKLAVEDDHP
jgi:hypothetical protein